MAKTVDISFAEVEADVVALLEEVRDQLPTISPENS
jgi:hypothetical protein